MDWGPKNTSVDIHHEPRGFIELRKELVEIRGLPDVPERLGMMHRDDAVERWRGVIPCRAVSEVGANERGNLTNRIPGDACRKHISYHHVALGMELLQVVVLDPLTDWNVPPLQGGLYTA